VPLAIWTATAYRRLGPSGSPAPGAVIGLPARLLAAASLAMSGLIRVDAGQLGGANTPELARALGMLWFAVGRGLDSWCPRAAGGRGRGTVP